MRECPKCGYVDPPYWKRSFQQNPQGEVDIARPEDLAENEPKIANRLRRGEVLVVEPFVYYLAPKAVWVKRVWAKLYYEGGLSAFQIPHERGRPRRP